MRKLLLAVGFFLFLSEVTLAGEVTLVKFDKDSKELTVREGEDEITYKVTTNTKFHAVDKNSGESIVITYDDAVKGLTNPKAEGKLMFDVTAKDGEVVEVKLPGRKKK